MMKTEKFYRKTFVVQAVQVTEENIAEVAEWCSGEIRTLPKRNDVHYVHVRVHRPMNERQTRAFIGDWVLYAGTGYKVYTSKAFEMCFEPMNESSEEKAVKPKYEIFIHP